MEPSRRYVISLDVHPDDSSSLSLRMNDQWVYAEVHASDLSGNQAQKQYIDLVSGYRRQIQQEEEVEQREIDAIVARKTEKSSDSGYASDQGGQQANKAGRAEQLNEVKEEEQPEDGEAALKSWILQALDPICDELALSKPKKQHLSLAEWFYAPIHCYSIRTDADHSRLAIVLREDLDGRDYIRKHLMPNIQLPKYLRSLKGIPWYKPEDLQVDSEADDVHMPIHPTVVSVPMSKVSEYLRSYQSVSNKSADSKRTTFFLKFANPLTASSVKREIRFLNLLQRQSLLRDPNESLEDNNATRIRAPRLAGLVSLPSSSSTTPTHHLVGFLLTAIPAPTTPLTDLMRPSIPQLKREAYADESQRMLSILHNNNLVWGDAKGDNFLVDGNGELWMIDFGGSFTEGWIDRELADTLEGDEMGVEKVVGGLEDPVNGVDGGDEGERGDGMTEVLRKRGLAKTGRDRSVHVHAGGKRRRDAETEDEHEEGEEDGDYIDEGDRIAIEDDSQKSKRRRRRRVRNGSPQAD